MKKRFQTLVKLGVFAGIVMYFINKSIEASAPARNLLKVQKDHFFEWRNASVYYTKTGSGSPILLIHDLNPASSSHEWNKVLSSLSETHTVYALDLPGCGRSEKPGVTYTSYFFVQLVTDFIDEIIEEKTDVIATGLSSSFVLMAAQMRQDLIGKITMINPLSPNQLAVIPDQKSKLLMYLVNCPIVSTAVYYFLTSQNQLEYDFSEKYFYNPFHLDARTIHTYYESAHLKGGDGKYLLASVKSNYVNFNINHALTNFKNELVLINGSDVDNSRQIASAYQAIQPNITCHFVEKTKMLPQLEAPERFLQFL